MKFRRMAIEKESPEELGYDTITCNLSESSVTDAVLGDLEIRLQDLALPYVEHRGDRRLREAIARQYSGIEADDVLVTPGAAAALFIVHVVLLEKGDHLLVEHPNYGTNLETPRALGCALDLLPLAFEDAFQPDLDFARRQVSSRTRLLSVTNPHNPTGVLKPEPVVRELLEIAAGCGARLLVDETYRDVSAAAKPPLAAALDARALSVSSMSKAYGLPGIRIGWIVTRDAALREDLLAAKEQIVICNSAVDEAIALQFLEARARFQPRIRAHIARNELVLREWMAGQRWLEWVPPQAAVVAFPRFRPALRVDTGAFYETLLREHRTLVGPGHWFEMDDRYLRIGFGYPTEAALSEGLGHVEDAARRSAQ
jgi:aspartate/methionine/tyrosine aminotransferase